MAEPKASPSGLRWPQTTMRRASWMRRIRVMSSLSVRSGVSIVENE